MSAPHLQNKKPVQPKLGRGTLWIRSHLIYCCRLPVKEVIHHDDVSPVVIRTRRCVAGYDSHPGYTSVGEDNTDE